MEINFNIPTKIIMKRDCVSESADLIASYGKKALIVTGMHSAMLNGSLVDVVGVLEKKGINYILFNKVMANPTIALAYEGARLAKAEAVDFIIAIGGGSPMDAAKAIALLAVKNIKENDLFTTSIDKEVLPMVFIPTTAGTGSEVTPYSILTNDKLETKSTISSPYLFPKLALLDGKYMKSLSRTNTVNTCLDALCHAIEGYLSVRATNLTKALSIEAIKTIASQFNNLDTFRLTIDDRDSLLYASTIAGIVIAHCGTVAVHILGYSLTYYKEIDHGRANGLLLVNFMKKVKKKRPDLIDELLEALSVDSLLELEAIINELLGERETLTNEEIDKYSKKALEVPKLKNTIISLNEEDLKDILVESMKGRGLWKVET